MSATVSLAGLAVGVSKPAAFVRDGKPYRFGPLAQVENDIDLVVRRLHSLTQSAGLPLVIEKLKGRHATRDAILGTIRRQIQSLAPAGKYLFVLEGHGTDVPDRDGDEHLLGYRFDQAFPTADHEILDDDLGELWVTRPDITIFTLADTCRAETITVRLDFDGTLVRQLGAIAPRRFTPPQSLPLIRQRGTDTGPSIVQFAAAARGTDADDVQVGGELSGRFSQAVLDASREFDNLRSYRAWFTASDAIVRARDDQVPVLYYQGDDPGLIDRRPFFVAAP